MIQSLRTISQIVADLKAKAPTPTSRRCTVCGATWRGNPACPRCST